MKNIHQNAIKYLTYLVLNKRKLDNKQVPTSPPPSLNLEQLLHYHSPPPKGGIKPYVASWLTVINIQLTGSHSCRYLDMNVTLNPFYWATTSYKVACTELIKLVMGGWLKWMLLTYMLVFVYKTTSIIIIVCWPATNRLPMMNGA